MAPFDLVVRGSAATSTGPYGGVNGYWGQLGSDSMKSYCDNSPEYITISFVNTSPENEPSGWPGTNFAGHCPGDLYYYDTPSGQKQSNLWKNCYLIMEGIPYCQQRGVKVLLSIGGEYSSTSNYAVTTEDNGRAFADFLYKAFGPLQPGYTGPRPFDSSDYSNKIDGFDFDIEAKLDNAPYTAMINRLRQLDSSLVITAAPQCPLAGDWFYMKGMIQNAKFDALFIQFYNNPECDLIGSSSNPLNNWNYDAWESFLATTLYNKGTKLYVGLPADKNAAGSGYVDASVVKQVVQGLKGRSSFGGVSLWDYTRGARNIDSKTGLNFNQLMQNVVKYGDTVIPATSTAVSSTTVTSSQTTTATSSTSSSSSISTTPTSTSTTKTTTTSSSVPSSTSTTSRTVSTSTSLSSSTSAKPTTTTTLSAGTSTTLTATTTKATTSTSSGLASSKTTSTSTSSRPTTTSTTSSKSTTTSRTSTLTSSRSSSSTKTTSTTSRSSTSTKATSTSRSTTSSKTTTTTSRKTTSTKPTTTSKHTTTSKRGARAAKATLKGRSPGPARRAAQETSSTLTLTSSSTSSRCTSTIPSSSLLTFQDYGTMGQGSTDSSGGSPTARTTVATISTTCTTSTTSKSVSSKPGFYGSSTLYPVTGYVPGNKVGDPGPSSVTDSQTVSSTLSTSCTGTGSRSTSSPRPTSGAPSISNKLGGAFVGTSTPTKSCSDLTSTSSGTDGQTPSYGLGSTSTTESATLTTSLTTSTVYTTHTYTNTKCPSSVANCPAGPHVTTEVVALYTTVCPVEEARTRVSSIAKKPKVTSALDYDSPASDQVTTLYTTKVRTLTLCHASVTDCALHSVTTEVSSWTATVASGARTTPADTKYKGVDSTITVKSTTVVYETIEVRLGATSSSSEPNTSGVYQAAPKPTQALQLSSGPYATVDEVNPDSTAHQANEHPKVYQAATHSTTTIKSTTVIYATVELWVGETDSLSEPVATASLTSPDSDAYQVSSESTSALESANKPDVTTHRAKSNPTAYQVSSESTSALESADKPDVTTHRAKPNSTAYQVSSESTSALESANKPDVTTHRAKSNSTAYQVSLPQEASTPVCSNKPDATGYSGESTGRLVSLSRPDGTKYQASPEPTSTRTLGVAAPTGGCAGESCSATPYTYTPPAATAKIRPVTAGASSVRVGLVAVIAMGVLQIFVW